ncbi:MAG: hypothetical protein R2822_24315 [Spirosomataceae bacterium]
MICKIRANPQACPHWRGGAWSLAQLICSTPSSAITSNWLDF